MDGRKIRRNIEWIKKRYERREKKGGRRLFPSLLALLPSILVSPLSSSLYCPFFIFALLSLLYLPLFIVLSFPLLSCLLSSLFIVSSFPLLSCLLSSLLYLHLFIVPFFFIFIIPSFSLLSSLPVSFIVYII